MNGIGHPLTPLDQVRSPHQQAFELDRADLGAFLLLLLLAAALLALVGVEPVDPAVEDVVAKRPSN